MSVDQCTVDLSAVMILVFQWSADILALPSSTLLGDLLYFLAYLLAAIYSMIFDSYTQ